MIRCASLITMADDSQPQPGRRAVLAALAAELGHDLQGPANLFRLMSERAKAGESFDDEDLSLLSEELERLSQIGSRLRALAQTPVRRARCSALEVAQAALQHRVGLELELHDAAASTVHCDQELLALALAELLDNARAASTASVGLRFAASGQSGFCVWDDGPGFMLEPTSALGWGVTTKAGAAGLGLTLALRAARAHGFNLEIVRQGSRTEVWLLIPAREIETGPAKLPG